MSQLFTGQPPTPPVTLSDRAISVLQCPSDVQIKAQHKLESDRARGVFDEMRVKGDQNGCEKMKVIPVEKKSTQILVE